MEHKYPYVSKTLGRTTDRRLGSNKMMPDRGTLALTAILSSWLSSLHTRRNSGEFHNEIP
jgi:hypothetical protein